MSSEDPFPPLAKLARPRLSPFFAGRVVARAVNPPVPCTRSRLMLLYWLVLACVAGTALAGTWAGVGALLLVAACSAFPGACARFVVAAAVGLSGRRAERHAPQRGCGASRWRASADSTREWRSGGAP